MIKDDLLKLKDSEYKKFNASLIPNIDPDTVIGVRAPAVRAYARTLIKERPEEAKEFLRQLPHTYHEENAVHMYILETIKDYDECIRELELFLPYVTNWAITDGHKFKAFKGNEDRVFEKIKEWTKSSETYTIRFGINMLMSYFLDDLFTIECNDIAAAVVSEEYYVNMMQAWYFATALAKQYDATLPYIENKRLKDWSHNKSIQKARESYRITPEQKEYLKSLKVSNRK